MHSVCSRSTFAVSIVLNDETLPRLLVTRNIALRTSSHVQHYQTRPVSDLALQRFNNYRWLALKIAGGFAKIVPSGVQADDLRAAAMLGLWQSALASASREGFSEGEFEAYVRIRVRGAIRDELRTQDQLSRRLRHELRVSGQKIDFVPASELNELAAPGDAEDKMNAHMRLASLRGAYDQLRPRLRQVLDAYLSGTMQGEIAKSLGVTEPRVSQLLERAREKLRQVLKTERPSKPTRRRRAPPA